MTDFVSGRDEVIRLRRKAADAERNVIVARARARKTEEAYHEVARRARPGDERQARRLRELIGALDVARDEAADAEAAGRRAFTELAGALRDFSARFDPRRSLAQLDDRTPLLLFPLRIETRFKSVGENVELWVRIFPDICLVDSFEPLLSDVERAEGRLFWMRWWRAGGIEGDQRAAWRALVASVASPRAAWAVRALRPGNASDAPTKTDASEIILVVPCNAVPTVPEQTAAAQYWVARWRAPTDPTVESAAASALATAVGDARAGYLITLAPFNLDDEPAPPLTRAAATVRVAFLALPDEAVTTSRSWNSAPVVRTLPERLVLRAERTGAPPLEVLGNAIPSPLAIGPEPDAAADDQVAQNEGVLSVPEPLEWLVDFDRAVAAGMGFRVPLTPEQAAAGFDRVIVLGVRLTSDGQTGPQELRELISHHRFGTSGFAMVPQGTPTNNTEVANAGYDRRDDPDASFDAIFREPAIQPGTAWEEKLDGQWLTELLGLDDDVMTGVEGAGGRDQIVARAMGAALWPVTLGYSLETLLSPIFPDHVVESIRWFYTHFVSGRGWLPAVRVGSQPYGILPTSAIRRWQWVTGDLTLRLLGAAASPPATSALFPPLLRTLRAMEDDWDELVPRVAAVGRPGDPHQILLDILGLHPTSVEFHQRFAQSVASIGAKLRMVGAPDAALGVLDTWRRGEARQLLRDLGYTGPTDPDILTRIFHGAQQKLTGPLIDDRPLSERDSIRAYTDDGRNYLRWLIDSSRTSLEELRTEGGFTADRVPNSLLYLLLRHALILGYWDAGVRLDIAHGVLGADSRAAVRREAPFIHVAAEGTGSESRWARLYSDDMRVTGVPGRLVAEHIARSLGSTPTRYLDEQVRALEHLEHTPTAQLERAFVEHIDCASYRLDAWVQGMIHLQLAMMRYGEPMAAEGVETARHGLYVGAFGWLEDVRPRARGTSLVELPPELAEFFTPPGAPTPMRDEGNGGYMFVPSLNQAVTAAVLRSGHLANATAANPSTLAVNLTSARVRAAQRILEGIRHGQSLGASLGYLFERGLHDRHQIAEVDQFILPLRKQFPLCADRLEATRTPADVSIETIEARNVIDGESLVDHLRTSTQARYPFGLSLPAATAEQSAAIDAEVDALLDAYDALADVALAESVHQAAQGNFERAAANLDAYGRGGLPPEPEVVRTPLGGTTITHRVAVHLPADASHTTSPHTGLPMTPRAQCEPRLNAWLASILPAPELVYCRVEVTDAVSDALSIVEVTQRDLGLQAVDVLSCLVDSADQAMGELDDRIVHHLSRLTSLRPDARFSIRFADFVPDTTRVSFFELSPLLRALRAIITRSRALRASDIQPPGEATPAADTLPRIETARVDEARMALLGARASVAAVASTLASWLGDTAGNRTLLLSNVDTILLDAADAGVRVMSFGVRAAVGEWYSWRASTTDRLFALVGQRAERWSSRRDTAAARLLAYDALPAATPDATRFAELETIQRLVAAQAATPRPADPTLARMATGNMLTAFEARLTALEALGQMVAPTLAAVRAAVSALLPLDLFDVEPFSLTELEDEVLRFLADLSSTLTAILDEVDGRLAASQRALVEASSAADAQSRVDALAQAAKATFGEEFRVVPFFDVPSLARGDISNALAHTTSGELLRFQIEQRANRQPVDGWIYGLARVRETLHAWEQVVVHAEAFGATAPALTPLQLPSAPRGPWLALEYPEETIIDSERLCYTACFVRPFDVDAPQCGLLLDEWTEVLPATEQTAAVTFHFDRPNAEPPQVWLLATPSRFGQGWSWDDIVESVREAFERARRRAVEPAQIDMTRYARFLPGVITAATGSPISIATNLARNNGLWQAQAEALHG